MEMIGPVSLSACLIYRTNEPLVLIIAIVFLIVCASLPNQPWLSARSPAASSKRPLSSTPRHWRLHHPTTLSHLSSTSGASRMALRPSFERRCRTSWPDDANSSHWTTTLPSIRTWTPSYSRNGRGRDRERVGRKAEESRRRFWCDG